MKFMRLDEFIALLSPVHSGKCDAQVISTNKQGFPAPVCITASYQQTALLTNTKMTSLLLSTAYVPPFHYQ